MHTSNKKYRPTLDEVLGQKFFNINFNNQASTKEIKDSIIQTESDDSKSVLVQEND